jgi:hypothetical protein
MRGALIVISMLLALPAYTPKNNFSVYVTIFVHHDRRQWTYHLDAGGISVVRHSLEGGPDVTVLRKDLTPGQLKKLDRYFAVYPLGGLEKKYINENIDGDTFTWYNISINSMQKNTYVFYDRPKDLVELNRVINMLLPRQYRLWD